MDSQKRSSQGVATAKRAELNTQEDYTPCKEDWTNLPPEIDAELREREADCFAYANGPH